MPKEKWIYYEEDGHVVFRVPVPVPGFPGVCRLAHPSILANCPRCQALPGELCKSSFDRGYVVITAPMVRAVKALLGKGKATQREKRSLRERIETFCTVKLEPHEERKFRYLKMPELHPPRRLPGRKLEEPSISLEAAKELERFCQKMFRRHAR